MAPGKHLVTPDGKRPTWTTTSLLLDRDSRGNKDIKMKQERQLSLSLSVSLSLFVTPFGLICEEQKAKARGNICCSLEELRDHLPLEPASFESTEDVKKKKLV